MKLNNDYLKVELKVEESKWKLTDEDLFRLVIRKNKKRHFLFASTVIGKYIAVHPYRSLLTSRLLAALFCEEVEGNLPDDTRYIMEIWKSSTDQESFNEIKNNFYELKRKTLFIGFAETATGLGHGVFSCFKTNAAYIHTTRAHLIDEQADLTFEEIHSHAVGHRCFIKEISLEDYERVVLIDDEITTGNTALNLIQAIYEKAQIKEFVVLSLLDWRSREDDIKFEALEEKLKIRIQCVSLLSGLIETKLLKEMDEIVLNNKEVLWEQSTKDFDTNKQKSYYDTIDLELDQKVKLKTLSEDGKIRELKYMKNATGRFGLTSEMNLKFEVKIKQIGEKLAKKRQYGKSLCLGSEEFIYIPNLISAYMGEGIWFACSARSPIITLQEETYALKDALCFKSPEDEKLSIYLYNIKQQGYEEIFWFLEREVGENFKCAMAKALIQNGIKAVHFVVC